MLLMKYNNKVNGLDLTYNGQSIQGSGLLSHETESGDLLSWCVGPLDTLRSDWVEYTYAEVVPTARSEQVGWIIHNQGWDSINAMTSADQDVLGLILNEAWLEGQASELDLASGSSVITGEHAATASSWLEASQGMSYGGINLVILVDDYGQSQATWNKEVSVALPPTAALLIAGAVACTLIARSWAGSH